MLVVLGIRYRLAVLVGTPGMADLLRIDRLVDRPALVPWKFGRAVPIFQPSFKKTNQAFNRDEMHDGEKISAGCPGHHSYVCLVQLYTKVYL